MRDDLLGGGGIDEINGPGSRCRGGTLMLLDVRMPGMDGFETYRRLRAMEELASLPVLSVTAEGDAEMATQVAARGGIDYVTKPFRKEVLLAHIRSHLRR